MSDTNTAAILKEISKNEELARTFNRIKAVLLESFLLFYSLLLCHRVIWNRFIFHKHDPSFHWNEIFVIAGVSLLGGALWVFSGTSLSAKLFGIAKNNNVTKYTVEIYGFFLFNITFIAGWIITQISIVDLFTKEGLEGANRILVSLFTPNFAIFDDALFAIIETVYIALLATLLSIIPTVILSFLTARNLMNKNRIAFSVYYILRLILNFIRSVEPLIWAIIFSVWVGIGPFAGMLALFVHTIASNAKLYSEAIEGIEQGPIEAISATGANELQIIWFAVVPQIILPFLSFTIYRWDINVRMATVIGLVGGGGIGTMLMQYQGIGKWQEVGLIVLMIALVVWVMDYVSAKIREAIY